MEESTLLAIDCGTQSLRALLFTLNGNLAGKVQLAYAAAYHSPRPGWAEQDPEVYWQSLCEACRQLRAKCPEAFDRICGVGVTTMRNSMVNVDAGGQPLRPTMIWLDQRKANPVYHPRGLMAAGIRLARMGQVLEKVQMEGRSNWIRQHQPDVWEKTHKYLQISGFLNFRLTGEFTDSVASQIGHLPFNYKKRRWGRRGEWLNFANRCFPIERAKLPHLVAPGATIGAVTRTATRATGLRSGLPVIACGSDKGCETAGSGVLEPTMASLSFGTTATVQTTCRRYFEALPLIPPYPAVIPGHYNPEIEIFRGYWMITWFKNEFAQKEVMEARKRGVAPEKLLNELLGGVPPGAMGLVVQPYWSPGLKEPAAKGAMIGFGDVHTRAHVFRAVIEGLAFGLLDGMQTMERRGRVHFSRLAVSGGASQSDEICQISADIINRPLVRGQTHETSGLGAAMAVAVGIGCHTDFKAAAAEMVHSQQVFEPNPRNVRIYDSLYQRVYGRIYKALAPLYEEIREITGYPE